MPQATIKNKIAYIDNIRVLLTVLVILHHTVIAYGGPGSWYFTDRTTSTAALVFMTMFVATNQAFFMGFFFFLGALFTEESYNKKGARKFITDRVKRLGIPLLFYSFVLSPVLNFIVYKFGNNGKATFLQYLGGYNDWIDFGVLWFVAALLLFTLIYVALRQFYTVIKPVAIALPGNNTILLFAITLGIISYAVRIFFPVGWVLHPVGFQLGHFTQYIALFLLGIVASRNNWLRLLCESNGKRWLVLCLAMIAVIFPFMYVAKTVTNSPLEAFQGKGSWQSFISALWEQVTGISIIVSLLIICCKRCNYSTPLLQRMARGAFATYIFQPVNSYFYNTIV